MLLVMWRHASRMPPLLERDVDSTIAVHIECKLWVMPMLYLLAVGISTFSRIASLIAFVVVPIVHVVLDLLDWNPLTRIDDGGTPKTT